MQDTILNKADDLQSSLALGVYQRVNLINRLDPTACCGIKVVDTIMPLTRLLAKKANSYLVTAEGVYLAAAGKACTTLRVRAA